MCNKQCRDENGFKCHLTSEAHKRQMDVFGQNPNKVIRDYSVEFEKTFLDHLRRTHPFSRVSANVVYNEYIQDRHHVHMNATKWLSLTQFVKYLGREGKCKVDETPKGWFIKLTQEDPFEAMERKKRREREKSEKEADERHLKILQAQAERARQNGGGGEEEARAGNDMEEERVDMEDLKSVSMSLNATQQGGAKKRTGIQFDEDVEDAGAAARVSGKKSKVEELMVGELQMKKQRSVITAVEEPGNAWVMPNIVVKVLSPSLKEHGYYKKKGRVLNVEGFVAEVEMIDSKDVLRVDQDELETVIPSPGRQVKVVKGAYRGLLGKLESLEKEKFGAYIKLPDQNEPIFLEYECFCKV